MENSNRIKLAIIVLAAVGLAMTPICLGQKVMAGKDYELKGVGKGSINCPDGNKVKNARINFFVFYQDGGTFAEWNVDQKSAGSTGGIITKQTITSSKYNLDGKEAFDKICDSNGSSKMSLSGDCGDSSTVRLQVNNGAKGTFKVQAHCDAVN